MIRLSILLGALLGLALPVFAATPVNINKADAATIAQSLDGIGPSKAAAIVAYREAHGPFKSVDDLHQIKGIGAATLERNRSAILLQGDSGKGDSGKAVSAKPAKTAAKPVSANH
ncbi:MAG: helix-hairpin-helix domain-containing protein [Dyella sp.]